MGTLLLADGTVIKGENFASKGSKTGELVFNTSMTGYQEILTDPSYAEQIVIMTYPEIGNYGINDFDFESNKPYVAGFIVKEHCKTESHYHSKKNISEYLTENNIVALEGIDTRSLVKKIRETGTINAYITSFDMTSVDIEAKLKELRDFKIKDDVLSKVTTDGEYIVNPKGSIKLAFIDYGAKKGIINSLTARDCKVTVFPASATSDEILEGDYNAVFLSNGPGDPAEYIYQINQIKNMIGKIPLLGICLGYQLLALAVGAKTYKLKYGHRGANHPVINLENNKVMMTSQNHGYAVDLNSVTKAMRPTYKNINDDTLEGFEISSLNIFAVQFHPEANPGPKDASIIFDEWVNMIKNNTNIRGNNER